MFIKTSLFTLFVWKPSDFRYPLQDHFPALLPGSELNPLPVWRRSTELRKLYRSTGLVQCALSSHRHHWDCRAPGSGSAAWNTKEIINCTKCSTSLLPFMSSYRWGRSTKAPGLLQSPWAVCSSLVRGFNPSGPRETVIQTTCIGVSTWSKRITKAINRSMRSFFQLQSNTL